MDNLFTNIETQPLEEVFETLLEEDNVRIERIVSRGHSSPKDFWYDQEQDEWIVVLKGEAKLRFEDDDAPEEMGPVDFLNIPAHRRHRVEWTSPDEVTIWLAIHYADAS